MEATGTDHTNSSAEKARVNFRLGFMLQFPIVFVFFTSQRTLKIGDRRGQLGEPDCFLSSQSFLVRAARVTSMSIVKLKVAETSLGNTHRPPGWRSPLCVVKPQPSPTALWRLAFAAHTAGVRRLVFSLEERKPDRCLRLACDGLSFATSATSLSSFLTRRTL